MKIRQILSVMFVALLAGSNILGQVNETDSSMVVSDSIEVTDSVQTPEVTAPEPDSLAQPEDSVAAVDDSFAAAQNDSLGAAVEEAAEELAEAAPETPVRRGNDEIVGEVIPWDWDDYTNVIEVGVRTERGREYELEKNDIYQKIFDHFLGLELRLFGDVSRDDDGFYFFRVDDFEMADSTATPPAPLPGSMPN